MALRAVEQVFTGSTVPLSIFRGTVAVSTTTVTGTNTFFTSDMVGMKIGFGANYIAGITTWYTITAWTSSTSITINTSAGTIAAGSAYVITGYDSTKTSIGSLMVQKTGPNTGDNYVGPLPVAIARPWEENALGITMSFPHAITISATIDWIFLIEVAAAAAKRIMLYEYNKIMATYSWKGYLSATTVGATATTRGFRAFRYLHTTGTITTITAPTLVVNSSTVTVTILGVVTAAVAPPFTVGMIGMMIGFGSTDVTKISNWCPIISFSSTTVIGIVGSSVAFAAGTAYCVASVTVTGSNTLFQTERIAAGGTWNTAINSGAGPRIGFGSTDPAQITTWYQIGGIASDTSMMLTTSPGAISGVNIPYVIEELRFAISISNGTVTNGGLFVVKGIGLYDFVPGGITIPYIASNVDNQRGCYWLGDTGAGTETNMAALGLAIQPEVSKGVHYAYVLDGTPGANIPMKCFRYNLRANGAVTSGKMTLNVAYYTTGTVTVSGGTGVTGASGASWTSAMFGLKIGFGSTSPANITTWYTIAAVLSSTSITLNTSSPDWPASTAYVIDTADVVATANVNVNGSVIGFNNGRVGTLHHGPGANEESLYFITITRVYRAAISKIFAGNLGWISDDRPEIPPGSGSTFAATGALNQIEIADMIDRLLIVSTGLAGLRHYVTRYPQSAGDQFDLIFGVDDKQLDQSLADPRIAIHFSTTSAQTSLWSENGITHIIKHGAAMISSQMYALPLSAHWTFAPTTDQRVIAPSFSTPNCNTFKRVMVSAVSYVGDSPYSVPTGTILIFYRTNGITDNSGAWIPVGKDGDLSSLAPASNIQFMFEFETIGLLCIPGRLVSVTLTYDDYSTDIHYQPSAGKTVTASKQFAWRFSTAFGTTVPTLRVRLYDAVTGGLLIDDNTVTPAGTWDKTTNGSTWLGSYNTSDKGNETTYIRYTPATLPDNTKVRALLTLY